MPCDDAQYYYTFFDDEFTNAEHKITDHLHERRFQNVLQLSEEGKKSNKLQFFMSEYFLLSDEKINNFVFNKILQQNVYSHRFWYRGCRVCNTPLSLKEFLEYVGTEHSWKFSELLPPWFRSIKTYDYSPCVASKLISNCIKTMKQTNILMKLKVDVCFYSTRLKLI